MNVPGQAWVAQIAILVLSAPIPASEKATATFTLAGKPIAAALCAALADQDRLGQARDVDPLCGVRHAIAGSRYAYPEWLARNCGNGHTTNV